MAIVLQGLATIAEEAASATVVCPVPAGTAASELLIASVAVGRTTLTQTISTPAGWTLIETATGSVAAGVTVNLYYKVATGSEPATYTWTTDAPAARFTASIQRLSGVNNASPIDVAASFAFKNTGTTTTITSPTLTTVTAGALFISTAALNAATVTYTDPPPGMSMIAQSTGTGRTMSWAYEERPTVGATGTRVWTSASSSQHRVAMSVAFRPSTGGGAPATSLLERIVGATGLLKTKTVNAVSVRIKIGTNSGVTTGVQFSPAVTPDARGDAIHNLKGLSMAPGATYFYRVEMTDTSSATSLDSGVVGKIPVAPVGVANFSLNFGSCCDAADSDSFTAIAGRGDAMFIHLGDLYYADGTARVASNYRVSYAARIQAPNHQKVFSTMASIYTWSDHDYMFLNAPEGPPPASAVAPANQVYRENWPAELVQATTGIYHSFAWGRCRIVILDSRTFKSDYAAPDTISKTMLGDVQLQWLFDLITNAPEPVFILASDTPWTGAPDVVQDDWAGFNTERQRIVSAFAASNKHAVVIAGDMHALGHEHGTYTGGIPGFNAAPLYRNSSQKAFPWDQIYPAAGLSDVQQYGRLAVLDDGSTINLAYTGYDSTNVPHVSTSIEYSTATAPPPVTTLSAPPGAGNVTTVQQASAAAITVNKPAFTADKDLLVCAVAFRNDGGTITPPTGWTRIGPLNTLNSTYALYFKAIPSAAAETSTTYTFTTSAGSGRAEAICFRVTGVNLSNVQDSIGAISVYTGTDNLALPAVSTVGGYTMLLALGIANNNSTSNAPSLVTPPPGMTTVGQITSNSGTATTALWVGSEVRNAAGSTGIKTAALAPAAANSGGFMVAITGLPVLAPAAVAHPDQVISSTGWAANVGTIVSAVGDESDATLALSPTLTTSYAPIRFGFPPVQSTTNGIRIRLRVDLDVTATTTTQVMLYEGSTTLIKTWTIAPDSISTIELTATAAEVEGLDWNNLELVIQGKI